ncbi:hypothetical protein HDE_13953 [Halotydeus destructor]|nr:hypothetical protein HDE_13953 [Halotydeus destructor]
MATSVLTTPNLVRIYLYENTNGSMVINLNQDGRQSEVVLSETPPTVVTLYENDSSEDLKVLLFYNDIWTTIDFREPFNPVPSQLYDFKSSATWTDCPQELCLDGQVDGADYDHLGRLIVFRGSYYWYINSKSTGLTPRAYALRDTTQPITVAVGLKFQDIFDFLLIYGQKVTMRESQSSDTTQATDLRSLFDLDMAEGGFGYHDEIYIVSNATLHVYLFEMNVKGMLLRDTTNKFDNKPISQLWSGLPERYDDVAVTGDKVQFFSGSFFFEGHLNGGPVAMFLMQERILACSDLYYAAKFSSINVTSLRAFANYRQQFAPKTLGDASATRASEKSYANKAIISFAIIVTALLIAFLTIGLVAIRKSTSSVTLISVKSDSKTDDERKKSLLTLDAGHEVKA